ncbi:unnamed protein product [Ostreobium quekettii]|uniref:DOMON domain-containing protein n=1 Tax=Ostreobium quekettii TaxID=121088 RepID=A0A8S1INP0_9CHLO|nr:unnamed protein product [Ostreobium quekettii]|eukprot:evm.model.scf_2300.1 EVM.evm.TU.scf_2300.1   scf_2300:673-5250(+)
MFALVERTISGDPQARTISPADEDTSIEIGDVAGSEIDGITTISFTWTVSAGNIPVDLSSGAIALNAAFGGSDALVRHEFTDRIGFSVDFLSGSDGGESLPAADGDEPSSPADEDTTAGTGAGTGGNAQVDGDDDAMSAASSSCPSSELPGYSCVISVPGLDRMRLHYISGPTTGNDAIPTLTASEIRFAVEGATSGWVGIGFAEQSGAMAPSDCVVGWVEDGVPDVRPYRVMSRSISPGDEDTSIIITDVAASEVDGNTTIAFTWNVASGNVPVDPSSGIVLMNAALGGSDGLVQHGPGERSSFLLSGVGVNNDITRYYKAHGALMIIAWLLCIPAGILCAHHKWCLKGIGTKGLWFQIHRGLQVVGIMATIAAFGIAVNKFECCKTEDGDRHKPLGATVFAMSLMNVVLGLFRPGTEAPRRWMFNYAHYFFGYGSFVLAIPTVFLGIFAYDDLTTEGVSTWVVLAVVALAGLGGLYVCMEVVRWFMGGDDTRKPTPSTVQLTMPVTSNQPQPQEVNGDKWKGAV